MEEYEPQTERAEEEIHHHAHASREPWVMWAALSSALLAALAAVSAMLSGHHANEAMLDRIRASDQWAYFQAKGVKAAVLGSKVELLAALGKDAGEKDGEKLAEYRKEQDEIAADAKREEADSALHMRRHVILSRGVTMFQVAIAVAAIAVLAKRPAFWWVGLVFGAAGVFFLARGVTAG
jgi:hypothetical protein